MVGFVTDRRQIGSVIGREEEIQGFKYLRRTKNNPCLIGEPGVGKTAVVEGLAQIIVEQNNRITGGGRVVSLDMASLL